MVKVTVQPDCGNAPKKALLRDFLVAFAEGNADFLIEQVTEDIEWEAIGDARIIGKTAFTMTVRRPNPNKTVELTLEHIITDGREAAVSGSFVLENGDSYAFADVYVFGSTADTKIKQIKSFNIKIE